MVARDAPRLLDRWPFRQERFARRRPLSVSNAVFGGGVYWLPVVHATKGSRLPFKRPQGRKARQRPRVIEGSRNGFLETHVPHALRFSRRARRLFDERSKLLQIVRSDGPHHDQRNRVSDAFRPYR